ncbi:hypothetical protein HanIR_Chr10g0483601 [Helianthus annuus]|nr:hypothetical protein HanIR_Chr10g0483601 [Helianthus annuus]
MFISCVALLVSFIRYTCLSLCGMGFIVSLFAFRGLNRIIVSLFAFRGLNRIIVSLFAFRGLNHIIVSLFAFRLLGLESHHCFKVSLFAFQGLNHIIVSFLMVYMSCYIIYIWIG